jgi:hypothetical protein
MLPVLTPFHVQSRVHITFEYIPSKDTVTYIGYHSVRSMIHALFEYIRVQELYQKKHIRNLKLLYEHNDPHFCSGNIIQFSLSSQLVYSFSD